MFLLPLQQAKKSHRCTRFSNKCKSFILIFISFRTIEDPKMAGIYLWNCLQWQVLPFVLSHLSSVEGKCPEFVNMVIFMTRILRNLQSWPKFLVFY